MIGDYECCPECGEGLKETILSDYLDYMRDYLECDNCGCKFDDIDVSTVIIKHIEDQDQSVAEELEKIRKYNYEIVRVLGKQSLRIEQLEKYVTQLSKKIAAQT